MLVRSIEILPTIKSHSLYLQSPGHMLRLYFTQAFAVCLKSPLTQTAVPAATLH